MSLIWQLLMQTTYLVFKGGTMGQTEVDTGGWLARRSLPVFFLLLIATSMALSFCFLIIGIVIGELLAVQKGPSQDVLFGLLSFAGLLLGGWLLIAARRSSSRIRQHRLEPMFASAPSGTEEQSTPAPAVVVQESAKDSSAPPSVQGRRAAGHQFLSWRFITLTGSAGAFGGTVQTFPLLAACALFVFIVLLWTTPVWPRLSRNQSRAGKAVVTGVALFVFLWNTTDDVEGTVGNLPTCDSRTAVTALKRGIKESPRGRTLGLELLDMNQIREQSWDARTEVRLCEAEGFYNSGREYLRYRIVWIDKSKGTWWIEVVPLITPRWRF
jgi:hypothetical protein